MESVDTLLSFANLGEGQLSSANMNWKKAAAQIFGLGFGLLNLLSWALLAALKGILFRTPSDNIKRQLAAAQKRYWNLNHAPSGLEHNFLTVKNGAKLHYVTKSPTNGSAKNLVIFIHGFPDSWILWKYYLFSSSLSKDATLVAVDLPGYGGSDDLPKYDATHMLETIAQFILEIKAQYIHSKSDTPTGIGRTVLVCHDWGTIIGHRLASEAPQLADRFVVTAAVNPSLFIANLRTRSSTAIQMLRSWKRNPSSYKLLQKAFVTMLPVLSQTRKSGYVFVFNLPAFIVNSFGRVGGTTWFYQFTHGLSVNLNGRTKLDPESKEAAEFMAASMGPSLAECDVPVNGVAHQDVDDQDTKSKEVYAYPPAVRRRAPDGGWATKSRIYRDGLFLKTWEKSMDTLWQLNQEDQALSPASRRRSSAGAALFDSGPEGSYKAKVTFLWGANDVAADKSIALHGIEDYLTRDSQVVLLQKTGHWMPVELGGREVIEEVVQWAIDGEKAKFEDIVAKNAAQGVKIVVQR